MLAPYWSLASSPAEHPGKGHSATSLSFTFIFTFRSHFPQHPGTPYFLVLQPKQPHPSAYNKRESLHCWCTADSPRLARVSAQLVPEDLPPTAGTAQVAVIAELPVRWLRGITYLAGAASSSRLKCSSLVPSCKQSTTCEGLLEAPAVRHCLWPGCVPQEPAGSPVLHFAYGMFEIKLCWSEPSSDLRALN